MPIDLLSTARELIAIDSRSSLSDRAVVDYLAPLCRAAGLTVSLQDEVRDGVTQWNLLATRGGDASPPEGPATGRALRLLLATHLDTVPPGDEATWTKAGGRPFQLTLEEGLLYGLGTADVKLDFLCKLAALERLREVDLAAPVGLAGTYGEEVGRWGAKLLLRRLSPSPEAILVGEPTGLRPCTAHKGYLEIRCSARAAAEKAPDGPWWRIGFEGVPAHSSQPHKGRSANDACLTAMARLWERERPPITAVRGGELVNKVAAAAEFRVCRKTPPELATASVSPHVGPPPASWSPILVDLLVAVHTATKALRDSLRGRPVAGFEPGHSTVNNGLLSLADGELRHVVDVRRVPDGPSEELLRRHLDVLSELTHNGRACHLTVDELLDEAPFEARPDSPLAAALRDVLRATGRPVTPEMKSGTTEAAAYSSAGIDTAVFGPGEAAGNIHRPNEHVPLDHLHAAVDVYTAVVRRLCGA